jgi:hypothetical protein
MAGSVRLTVVTRTSFGSGRNRMRAALWPLRPAAATFAARRGDEREGGR